MQCLATVGTSRGTEGYDAALFDHLAAVEEESFWFRCRNRLIVQLASEISKPGDRCLEVGCGTGYVLRALARDCGLRVTGAELFSEGLEHARVRVPEAELVELDAREMPYDAEFDLAGAFDVLEHVDDDAGVLRGIQRALRPGGHLMLTVPQHPSLWSDADAHAHHLRRYRRQELIERVEVAGFAVLRTTSFVSSLLPAMALARWRQRFSRERYDPVRELLPSPRVNRFLEHVLGWECALINLGVDFPIGGSLVLIACRTADS
jgi:SAM-dependent methyltransferase